MGLYNIQQHLRTESSLNSSFSLRNKYVSPEPILEDAPGWLRELFVARLFNWMDPFLGFRNVYELFCALSKQSPQIKAGSDWEYWMGLAELLRTCEWYNFFDLVQLLAQLLKSNHPENFPRYKRTVNELFAVGGVGWRLDGQGELIREVLKILEGTIQGVRDGLASEFQPAADHFQKAHKFLYGRPADSENAIKEIVSSVESVGKALYPRTSTLGDAVKAMRSEQSFPALLVSMIDKFYAYASAEPAVRHGLL